MVYTDLNTWEACLWQTAFCMVIAFCNFSFSDFACLVVQHCFCDQTFCLVSTALFLVIVTKTWKSAFFMFCGELQSLHFMNWPDIQIHGTFCNQVFRFESLAIHYLLIYMGRLLFFLPVTRKCLIDIVFNTVVINNGFENNTRNSTSVWNIWKRTIYCSVITYSFGSAS